MSNIKHKLYLLNAQKYEELIDYIFKYKFIFLQDGQLYTDIQGGLTMDKFQQMIRRSERPRIVNLGPAKQIGQFQITLTNLTNESTINKLMSRMDMTREEIDKLIENAPIIDKIDLENFTVQLPTGNNKVTLFLVENNEIIGYLYGTIDTFNKIKYARKNGYPNLQRDLKLKYDIDLHGTVFHIDYVHLASDRRGFHPSLCNNILNKIFEIITEMRLSIVTLENVAGIGGCVCYVKNALLNKFKAYNYVEDKYLPELTSHTECKG